MKSHSVIFMTLGLGFTYTMSCNQKSNTKCSTDSELVSINDAMAQVMRTRHFLAQKGMIIPRITIYQHNKRTIDICQKQQYIKHSKNLASERHSFFVTDKIKMRDQGRILSNAWHAREFLYQASTGDIIHTDEGKILNLPVSTGSTVRKSLMHDQKASQAKNNQANDDQAKSKAPMGIRKSL